jgi:tetratricopeptide (TPR) repeat protein
LLLLLGAAPGLHAQSVDTDQAVQKVLTLYQLGRYEDAELEGLRVLNRSSNLSASDAAEIHRVLAYVAVARGDNETAIDQFIEALRLNPRLRMDRVLTSPKILTVYDEAKDRFESESKQEMGSMREMMERYRVRLEAGRRSILFPGRGQFYKNQTFKGYLYAGGFVVSAGGLLASHLAVLAAEDRYDNSDDPGELPDLYDEYRSAWQVRNALAISTAVVYLASIVDGFVTNPAETKRVELTSTPPAGSEWGMELRFTFDVMQITQP